MQNDEESREKATLEDTVVEFYSGEPMDFMHFGRVEALNVDIYSVKVFGIPEFRSSITVVHEFFGKFKVTSMLSKKEKQGKVH